MIDPNNRSSLFLWLLLVTCIIAAGYTAGCAAGTSGPERARLAGHELTRQYLQLHRQYAAVHDALPATAQDWLKENVAPRLNTLKGLVITYNDLAIAWSRGAHPERDMDALFADIQTLATDVAGLLVEANNE